jgi:2',3'-cyclic-nucleotide 2'-phosphodiesterase (5'-nucleotidase family)
MNALAKHLDRYFESTSPDFLIRAFFPWVFVILLNILIYEIWIPDGGSFTGWLAKLNEHVQLYAAIAIILSIAAIATISDGVVELAISWLRRPIVGENAPQPTIDASQPPADAPSSQNEQTAAGGLKLKLAEIAIAETGAHRSGNLALGMGVSIWLNAFELVQYQPSLWIRVAIVSSLVAVMAISMWVAGVQLNRAINLQRQVASSPESPERGMREWLLHPLVLATVVLFFVLPLLYLYVSNCLVGRPTDPVATPRPLERRITILAINDVYRLDGVSEGRSGGLARVRTLRKLIEKDDPNALLLHAGDFLSPSLIGRVYKGRQMIDVMNNLDGDPVAFDKRMFVVFGNHEFDDSKCNKLLAPLNVRVEESQFTWLAANLDFTKCPSMQNILARPNVKKDGVVLTVNGVKVGLFGIGLTTTDELDEKTKPMYPPSENVMKAAEDSIRSLRDRGAEFVIGITHLPEAEDSQLIKAFSPKGLDLLIGGHDHSAMVLPPNDPPPRGFKADSDARTAWRIDIRFKDKKPQIDARLIELDQGVDPDPAVGKLAAAWSERAEAVICTERARTRREPYDPNCLSKVIGWSQSPIELEETANRSRETGIGNWLADLLLDKTNADVAIINSGILGLGENLTRGELKLRHAVDMFRFDNVVAVWEFPAHKVCEAIRHGFRQPGLGAWPHVGGVEVEIKLSSDGTNEATVKKFIKQSEINCENLTAKIKVVSFPYLLCGGDKYPLEAVPGVSSEVCQTTVQDQQPDRLGAITRGETLGEVTEREIIDKENEGIKPKKNNRLKLVK